MAYVAANTQAPLGAVVILRAVDSIVSVKSSVVAWNQTRKTRKVLSKLSNEQLQDIGLTRTGLI